MTPIKYCSSSFRHVPVVPHSSWTICLHLRPLHGVTYFIIHYNNIIYISLGAISSVMARVTKLGIMKQMPRHGAVFGQLTGCHDQSTQHPAPKIYYIFTHHQKYLGLEQYLETRVCFEIRNKNTKFIKQSDSAKYEIHQI